MKHPAVIFTVLALTIAAGLWIALSPSKPPAVTDSPAPAVSPTETGPPAPVPMAETTPESPAPAPTPAAPAAPAPAQNAPPEIAAMLADLAQLEPGSEDRGAQVLAIAEAWAGQDPGAALAWAFGLEIGLNRAAAGSILRSWSKTDPGAAADVLESLQEIDPRLHRYATNALFSHWAGADPTSAWEAADSLAPGPTRTRTEADILMHWASTDPATAANLLSQAVTAGTNLDEFQVAFQATASQLAITDPRAATDWVDSLPDGPAKIAALTGMMNSWLIQDPEAASGWLRDLPSGEARDAGIASMVHVTRRDDPESALIWATALSDPAKRTRLAGLVSLGWLTAEPEAARAAIDRNTGLTPAEKETIFTKFSQEQALLSGDASAP